MDRLQTMSVFVAVAEENGFAPAARRLNMSPPSVTRSIADLEARLGARLLHRTTRRVSLTDAGGRYLADCRRILQEIDEADQHAVGVHAEPAGDVSITASVLFGQMILSPMLLDLLERYPKLSVSTVFVDRVVHMMDEGIDVAIRIAELPDSSLAAARVGSVRRVLCAAPGYLDDRGRPNIPPDLSDHELIDFPVMTSGGEWNLERDGKATPFRTQTRLKINIAAPAIDAAVQGHGITRVLSYMVAEHVAAGRLEIVLPDYEPPAVPIHVVHKEAGQTSARVRATVDHLVEQLRNHPALR